MSKKCHLCVILASILADSESIHLKHTPLKISNDITGSEIKIGTSDDDEAWLLVFCDIWVAMNTVILLVHQWIITQNPDLKETNEQFYNHDAFGSIDFAYAVDNSILTKTEWAYGKLTTVVTCHTLYTNKSGKQPLLSIGLGGSVAVIILLGLLSFHSWIMVIDIWKIVYYLVI